MPVGELKNLTELTIRWNKLTKLPNSIEMLSKLQKLDIGSNQLSQLPESIGMLTDLTELYIDKNHFTKLPESLEYLVNLNDDSNDQIKKIYHKIELEKTDWIKAKMLNTKSAYEEYLNNFSNGSNKVEAIERIDTIINQEKAILNDNKAWEETKRSNTLESYSNYIYNFPIGVHITECKELYKIKQESSKSLFGKIFKH